MNSSGESWRTLLHLAVPYRRTFVAIGMLAALATAAELVEPLIYRIAINDVTGVFVVSGQGRTLLTEPIEI